MGTTQLSSGGLINNQINQVVVGMVSNVMSCRSSVIRFGSQPCYWNQA